MLKVDEARLFEDLDVLSKIAGTPSGGVSRPALSEADLEVRAWFRSRAEQAGLDVRQDGAGNLSAVLPAHDPGARTVLAGSHLDSVPNGGRFDGALGVLCALEALRTVREAGVVLPVALEAISFTDEEGTWLGLLGSRALVGSLIEADLVQVRGGTAAFEQAMGRVGITRKSLLSAQRDPRDYVAFVEVHIEQGTRLEEQAMDIGVVPSIVGIRWYRLHFFGEAAHAGTQPMNQRKDALWGAGEFVAKATESVKTHFAPGVMNCGQLRLEPGAFNIVPAEAKLSLEFRHSTEADLDAMETRLLDLAHRAAKRHNITLETHVVSRISAAPLNDGVITAIERATATLGLKHTRLLSYAGHDTQSLSMLIPSAMFFVPSVDGISHNPREFTRPHDVLNAANIMLHTLLVLADAE